MPYTPELTKLQLIEEYRDITPYDPSEYQAKVFHFVDKGKGHGIINSAAGSGKTDTIVYAAGLIPIDKTALLCAFNKHIAVELEDRLKGTEMTAKTMHSIGYGALAQGLPGSGRLNVQGWKYKEIVNDFVSDLDLSNDKKREAKKVLKALVELVRLNLADPTDMDTLENLCLHHDLGRANGYLRFIPSILRIGNRQAESGRRIDFTDMVYLPVHLDLPVPQFDFVFVDEAQDLNTCQLEIAMKSCKDGGRMIFVGDPNQAIYGFAGADARSFANIKKRTDATELPLSICYRCGTDIVEEAQTVVPSIEPFEENDTGTVRTIQHADIESELRVGDLVLCRTNAELIGLCLQLIAKGRTARVKGRDIGRNLTSVLEELEKQSGFRFDNVMRHLQDWAADRRKYLLQKDASETAFQMLEDKVAALEICIQHFDASSVAGLCREIENLFSDDKEGIWLSSVHKAKGLENDRVFIIQPQKLPLEWDGQLDWQFEQEMNLRYVAITRAKKELVWVENH